MQETFGKEVYHVIPDTYSLPEEAAEFTDAFRSEPGAWIVKPPNSSQGKGIYLLDSLNEVQLSENVVVSKYIHNPYLIQGFKFDLRIYVLVTSMDPMRIYLYDEGLVRFASEPYDINQKLNQFAHLTNYSLNK
jgi:tubulin polyglutamylase TTLL5